MSKKHYQALARMIASHYADAEGADAQQAIRAIAKDMARIMAADNPRFDRGRFLAACGIA